MRGLGIAPRETIPKLQERQLMKTSIVICFYERLDFLKCCLNSLRNASNDFDEVIIADDGSGEDIVLQIEGLISQYDFSIIHAWHPREGPRRAATRNNGIRHAEGDYLIFLDADVVTLPGSIRSHLDAAKPGYFVAGRRKDTSEEQTRRMLVEGVSDKLLETIYKELSDEPIIKEHREFIRYGILRKLGLANPRKVTFGGHFSIFRKDIESVNGYDENYVGWGAEDQDMALRLVMAGFNGRSVIPEARVLHLWHLRELGDKNWEEGTNVKYFFRNKISVFCENGLKKVGEKIELPG